MKSKSEIINYISNIPIHSYSGGWSGMNHFIHKELKNHFSLYTLPPINPPYFFSERLLSKLLRLIYFRGAFPAFSDKRLTLIGQLVKKKLNVEATFNFFHGSTPWVLVSQNQSPYACYVDACFGTYINIYQDTSKFLAKDIHRIEYLDSNFLENAHAVFFSSKWALEDAKKRYQLKGGNFFHVGLGAGIEPKNQLIIDKKPYFLFVGLDFEGKGGPDLIQAFLQISNSIPEFKLYFVGISPPEKLLKHPKINYLGFFDKSKPKELHQLIRLIAEATCMILPTSKDITPLVLLEAGYLGCPVISVRRFGIPEIIIHNETGILLEPNTDLQRKLAEKMLYLAKTPSLVNQMAINAQRHTQQNFRWELVGKRIKSKLDEILHNA